jgi:hypothetical protein
MRKLIVENLRCFHGRHELELRPLTLLVGENSTGKSTILAALRTAESLGRAPEASLNEEPFNLGAFDDIASYAPGRTGRAGFFRIGLGGGEGEEPAGAAGSRWEVLATFRPSHGQPLVTELRIERGSEALTAERAEQRIDLLLAIQGNGREEVVRGGIGEATPDVPMAAGVIDFLLRVPLRKRGEPRDASLVKGIGAFRRFVFGSLFRRGLVPPYAIAPVRTRPERTYDPKTGIRQPGGDHVPMVLARTYESQSEEGRKLRTRLLDFGAASGLFKSLTVRRLGKAPSDPFQVRVKVSGIEASLLDVGYGVSQVLPIIVDAAEAPKGSTFLMQQPEVHLHPRAQAALGSFLGKLAKEDGKRFVVETHSDYLIDRIRLDVRDQVNGLLPEDVSILFFERKGPWVTIHPIQLDDGGNVVEAPESYRAFFLEEQARLFGV